MPSKKIQRMGSPLAWSAQYLIKKGGFLRSAARRSMPLFEAPAHPFASGHMRLTTESTNLHAVEEDPPHGVATLLVRPVLDEAVRLGPHMAGLRVYRLGAQVGRVGEPVGRQDAHRELDQPAA